MKQNQLKLYPNPAHSHLTLHFPRENNQVVYLKIQNQLGKTVKTRRFYRSGNSQKINISSLPAGIYFINFNHSDQIIRKKFIKH